MDFILKHSYVSINAIKIRAEESEPSKLALYNGYIDSFVCALVTYLRKKASRLINNNPPFSNPPFPNDKNPTVDITLTAPLHVIAFASIMYSKNKIRKRERKLVGNKNE